MTFNNPWVRAGQGLISQGRLKETCEDLGLKHLVVSGDFLVCIAGKDWLLGKSELKNH